MSRLSFIRAQMSILLSVASLLIIVFPLQAAAASAGSHNAAQAHARAVVFRPIVLVVDSAVQGVGLAQSDALKRSTAFLPFSVLAPSYVPSGSTLFTINVARPSRGVNPGTATLAYGVLGKVTAFEIDESPSTIYFVTHKEVTTSINGNPGTIYYFPTLGSHQLIAIAWNVGKRGFDITSDLGKSRLSVATLLKIALSVH